METIQYKTEGTCCALMNVAIDENIVKDVEFMGGCRGNLEGIRHLIIGMNIDDIISRLKGIKCGAKQTSCPDQLSRCLLEYKNKSSVKEVVK